VVSELEVLERADQILRERGYAWHSFGRRPGPLCVGGALNIAMGTTGRFRTHAAIRRVMLALDPSTNLAPSAYSISQVTRPRSEVEVRAALAQAISECRAEEYARAEVV